jgi:hypothetical protein
MAISFHQAQELVDKSQPLKYSHIPYHAKNDKPILGYDDGLLVDFYSSKFNDLQIEVEEPISLPPIVIHDRETPEFTPYGTVIREIQESTLPIYDNSVFHPVLEEPVALHHQRPVQFGNYGLAICRGVRLNSQRQFIIDVTPSNQNLQLPRTIVLNRKDLVLTFRNLWSLFILLFFSLFSNRTTAAPAENHNDQIV